MPMLIRFSPAARNSAANRGRSVPFVVIETSSSPGVATSRSMNAAIPRRNSGSPPVTRSLSIPSRAATAAKARISS